MSFENPGEIGQQRENSDSTSGVGHRRWFLRASVAGVVGVAVAETTRRFGLWHLADLGIGDLAELERELTKEREEFAKEYLESGEMPGDEEKIAELFVVTELVRYFRENQSQSEVDIETFEKNTYRPFMDGVATHFAKRQEETDPTDEENVDTKKFATPSVALIANAKLALYDQIGAEPFYWAKKNNIIDAMTTDDLQCRSGSRLLLLTIMENAQDKLQEGEKLVVIYSNHHVQLGLLTKENRVIAFEMTKSGKGIEDYGPMEEIQKPVVIADAMHDLAQAGIDQKAHPEKTILFDNVPDSYAKMDEVFEGGDGFGGGGIRLPQFKFGLGGGISSTTDQYGFGDGKLEIPDARTPITPMDYIPSNIPTGNGVYDTLRSGKESMREIYRLFNAEERISIDNFEQHTTVISHYYSSMSNTFSRFQGQHTKAEGKAMFDKYMSDARELGEYIDTNNLDELHAEYLKAIKSMAAREKVNVSYPRNPRTFLIDALESLKRL